MNKNKYLRLIISTVCVILGISLGLFLAKAYVSALEANKIIIPLMPVGDGSIIKLPPEQKYMLYVIFTIVFAFLGFIAEGLVTQIYKKIINTSNANKLIYLSGFILGIMLAAAFRMALGNIKLPLTISIVIALILIAICIFALRSFLEQWVTFNDNSIEKIKLAKSNTIKFLDTNVIIDGRIADICKTGFIEGEVVVPKFILMELQLISDSSDSLKRARGRRGLEILNNMQKEFDLSIKDTPMDSMKVEVDSKLVMAAIDADATIITNDYNLNKVASLQDVKVLNINELANALKPVVMPGEQMKIAIMKEGKEKNQGIAYLDDGTMIVVEDAGYIVGQTALVEVTSVLQTAQGKMIFAKIKDSDGGDDNAKGSRSNTGSRRK